MAQTPSYSDESAVRQWESSVPVWRRRLAHLGLQGKLLICFVLLLAITLGTACWAFWSRTHAVVTDMMGQQAMQISYTLALAGKTSLQTGEVGELDRIAADVLKSRDILFVGFFDAGGHPLVTRGRGPSFDWRAAELHDSIKPDTRDLMRVRQGQSSQLGPFLVVTAPVMSVALPQGEAADVSANGTTRPTGTQLLGYVVTGLSPSREQSQVRQVTLLALTVGWLGVLISLPLAAGLVHRIFQPIRELVAATRRIASGNYEQYVATYRPDDIGVLARSFSEMVRRVREQQEALQVANESLAQANRTLEQKVAQRTVELQAANQRLTSEIAEKEDFLRAVSHDLSAPLRNISGMAAMLLMKHKEIQDEDVLHRLDRIQQNVQMETDLIGELLELSRIKTRRQTLENVDLQALVTELGGIFENDLRSRSISLISDEPLPVIHAEKARWRQVYQNLIDNAIKYMGSGPVREIHTGWALTSDGAELYVHDTGIGIEPGDLGTVFCVFRRGKSAAVQEVAGKGVGLATVKSIIETCNGQIRVESQVGQGTTFRFTIAKDYLVEARPLAA